MIGQAVTDLVNTFEPEVVVLGGGVTRAGDVLIRPVRDIVAATGDAARRPRPPASSSPQLGESVCVVGAAARAFDYLEEHTLVR